MAGRAKPKILGFAKQSFDMGRFLRVRRLVAALKGGAHVECSCFVCRAVRLGVLNVQVLRSSKYPANGHELVGPITGDG
jgi:hypothetical protein